MNRDELLLENLDLPRREARRWSVVLEQEDLEQEGRIGLLRAARRFDPSRGVPFRAFATLLVRGAVLEAVRASARRRGSPYGIVQELSLERMEEPELRRRPLQLASERPGPDAVIEQRETLRLVAELPEIERRVLIRTRLDGLSGEEMGREVGVSPNRIYQIVGEGTERLRRRAA